MEGNIMLTPEMFPLHGVLQIEDLAGKASENGCFTLPYMKRVEKQHAKYSSYVEIKIAGHSYVGQLCDHERHVKGNTEDIEKLERFTHLNVNDELNTVLRNEIISDITQTALLLLFTAGELTRLNSRSNVERVKGILYNRKKKHVIKNHGDISKVLNRIKSNISRRAMAKADYIVTNSRIAAVIGDSAGYSVIAQPSDSVLGVPGFVYPTGQISGMTVYVDPRMKWTDTRMLVGTSTTKGMDGVYVLFDSSTLKYGTSVDIDERGNKIEDIIVSMKSKVSLVGRNGDFSFEMPECELVHLDVKGGIF